MRIAPLLTIVIMSFGVNVASAQEAQGQGTGGGSLEIYQPTINFAPASTIGEGHARGMADVVRSAAYANLLNSRALINVEEARMANLETRRRLTETYFDIRRMNREFREAARPRPTTEQLFRLAQQAAPDRLSPSELDPLTGEIVWPRLLTVDVFAPQRQLVEQVYRARARGEISYEEYQASKQTVESMLETLVGLVDEVPPQDYVEARSFLTSLRHEARLASR